MKRLIALFLFVVLVAGGIWFAKNHQSSPSEGFSTPMSSMGERDPASSGVTELNSIIFGIKSKARVDSAIDQIVKYANAHPEEDAAQIYAAVLAPLKLFKGFVYRLRMIVEPVDALYIASINQLRMFKRNNSRRAQHIDALFDYIVDPNPTETIAGQKGIFTSMHQLQDYLAEKVAPEIDKKIETVSAIANKYHNLQSVFYYDAALLVGEEDGRKMTSQTRRYRKVMPAHLMILVANMQRNLGFLHYAASYDLEDMSAFLNRLMSRTLVSKKSQFMKSITSTIFDIHLQSPKEFGEELRRAGRDLDWKHPIKSLKKGKVYADFFTLREGKGTVYLPKSLEYLQQGVASRLKAYEGMEALENRPNQNEYLLNARLYTSRPGMTLAILRKRQRILSSSGPMTFSDRVTGREFQLNVSEIFNPQNPNIQDLKTMYANSFAPGPEKYGKDTETFRWNYEYGAAIGWPDPSFAGVLPGTSSADDYKGKLDSLSRDASTRVLQVWLRAFM